LFSFHLLSLTLYLYTYLYTCTSVPCTIQYLYTTLYSAHTYSVYSVHFALHCAALRWTATLHSLTTLTFIHSLTHPTTTSPLRDSAIVVPRNYSFFCLVFLFFLDFRGVSRHLFLPFFLPTPPLLALWEKSPMWKPRLSPRSESKRSDSNHLHLPEIGFLGRSRKKSLQPGKLRTCETHFVPSILSLSLLPPPFGLIVRPAQPRGHQLSSCPEPPI
jgi:hypothetical protein